MNNMKHRHINAWPLDATVVLSR